MDLNKRASLLARTPLFAGASRAALERLAGQAVLHRYRRGQFIFGEGERGGSLVVMTSGMVKLFATAESGTEMVVGMAQPYDTFGEITVIDGGLRTASAEAVALTTVLILGREPLFAVIRGEPDLAEVMLVRLAERLRATHQLTADLMFLDLAARVAKLLVTAPLEPGGRLDLERLHLTQRDLGGMVGGSRQRINRILQDFQSRGWIRMEDRTIVVIEFDRLRRRAGP